MEDKAPHYKTPDDRTCLTRQTLQIDAEQMIEARGGCISSFLFGHRPHPAQTRLMHHKEAEPKTPLSQTSGTGDKLDIRSIHPQRHWTTAANVLLPTGPCQKREYGKRYRMA